MDMIHTEETKTALSNQRTGSKNPFFGRKHTQEAKDKMAKWTKEYNSKRKYDITPLSIKIPLGNDLYYLAGIIDGEGSIRFSGGRPFVAVYNSSLSLMRWLKNTIGGEFVPADKRGREICYTWRVQSSKNVYWLCIALWDALIIKQDDAIVVINFLKDKYGSRL